MNDFDLEVKIKKGEIVSRKERERRIAEAKNNFEKAKIKEAFELLIDNMEIEEAIKVIKEDKIKDFIFPYENYWAMKFNKYYYNKWKLKNKIYNF